MLPDSNPLGASGGDILPELTVFHQRERGPVLGNIASAKEISQILAMRRHALFCDYLDRTTDNELEKDASQMIARTIRRLTPAAVLLTAASTVPFLCADAAESAKPYTVKNGVVDAHTFTGYLHYEGTCYWCHGQDGTGSTFAPSLVDA